MEKLHQFLEKRPAIRLHYELEGSYSDWARHFISRIPMGQKGRLVRLISLHAAAQNRECVNQPFLEYQLKRYPIVSTADHAGLLNYNILYNANLLMAGLIELEMMPYQIVLATSRIPLNNISYPRGFYFGGTRFSFFPVRIMRVPVCLVDERLPYSSAGNLAEILGADAVRGLDPERRKFLEYLLFERLGMDALDDRPFPESACRMNADLWENFFLASQRENRPRLIYLTQETLVLELLLEDIPDRSSLVHMILFDPRVRGIYLEEFEGISGCWGESGGTHFFWGVNGKRGLYPLRVDSEGRCLVPALGGDEPSIPLEPEPLLAALAQKRLVPSLFIDMLLLAFVEGFSVLGGFNQVTYLAWMRVAHERCMLRLGDWPMAARFARTPTDGLICGPLPFPQWDSGLDLMWSHNSSGGKFNGNMDGGLGSEDLQAMMRTPMRKLIQNGVDAMLDVVD
jgi:hypothetical protein